MAQVDFDTKLTAVVGTPAKKLAAPPRHLETVRDLLEYYPRRYIDATKAGTFAEFHSGDYAVLTARVQSITKRSMRARKGQMAVVTIVDSDGHKATATFFNAYPHYELLRPETLALFSGEMGSFNGQLQLTHPQYTLLDDELMEVYPGNLVPVYKQVPKVTNLQLTQTVGVVLDAVSIADPLPVELREAEGLVDLATAYRGVHLPTSWAQVQAARERLKFDEAFLTQMVLAQRRHEARQRPATARPKPKDGLLDAFDAALPFTLTEGQADVGSTIADDLASTTPMNRLLQGEVGSGKTLVALRAMLQVVDAGGQAALLAPTEVLAAQHASSIRAMLGPLAQAGTLMGSAQGTQVALLTGSMSQKARGQAMLDIVSGQAGIVIGTHALLQDKVEFADLGLVVVDEQHRFGVEQRALLTAKSAQPPHVLVMTATPIPRTVAMTAFGDLDVSTLRSLPKGRAPIVSHVVPAHNPVWMDRVWQRLAEECAQGRQAYVVAGRIGRADNETSDDEVSPVNVTQLLDDMRANPALAGLRMDVMHGRLPSEDKDVVMRRFSAGELDVLVATTVIEVGVDVPNASMIVIMDADRFGLSQLHQLRGRVGRGSTGGLCLLVTQTQDRAATDRLERVSATTNGFDIADLDLELRREGDVLGAAQSGRRSSLEWLSLTSAADLAVIETARAHAGQLVESDPHLDGHSELAATLHRRVNDEQAQFLEKS